MPTNLQPPNVADQLREAINNCGIKLGRLAEETGISQPALWRFVAEGDRRHDIYLSTAATLCTYFGLTLAPTSSLSGKQASPLGQLSPNDERLVAEKLEAAKVSPREEMAASVERVADALRAGDVVLRLAPKAKGKVAGRNKKKRPNAGGRQSR